MYDAAINWQHLNTYWFNSFPDPSTRLLIFYDELFRDTQHELEKAIAFLNIGITKHQIKCVMTHKEGFYHRPKKIYKAKLFDDNTQKVINGIKERVYRLLKTETNVTMLS